MKHLFLVIALVVFVAQTHAQVKNNYQYTIDLTNVVDDKLYVELIPPTIKEQEIIFYFPKMIPGTYAIENYGRFVSKLEVLDKKGSKLSLKKLDEDSWLIKNANKAVKISYWIEDSFDTKLKGPEVFWPAGTNIEADKNFLINNSGFFGYFQDYKKNEFTLNFIRPQDFYGATGLKAEKTGELLPQAKKEIDQAIDKKRLDVFKVSTYDKLIDSPIMYAKPDTAIIRVGNAEVLIGSYSPNKLISAIEIANNVKEVLLAQKEYLGGRLPVDKYAFIFYFTDQPVYSYGALEHSYSSVYYMPEAKIEDMKQQLRDFAAHEFFHIVTPLTIHSEEIGMFGFNNPKMSRHLWLYEGLTEYFAGNVQVKYGLISPQEYLQVIQEKMAGAEGYIDNLPFTELSLGALDKYANQYGNVYQKGALISMCLDIQLRKLSKGKYSMQNLVAELGSKYGTTKSFKDEELFAEITKMTYPQIGEFFSRYVAGTEPLPMKEILSMAGVEYEKEIVNKEFSLGLEQEAITLAEFEGKPKLAIGNEDALNSQGKAVGLKTGDILLKINGNVIPDLGPELGAFIQQQQQLLGEGKILTYTVVRKKENVELSTKCILAERKRKNILFFNENSSAEQLLVRQSWLKP